MAFTLSHFYWPYLLTMHFHRDILLWTPSYITYMSASAHPFQSPVHNTAGAWGGLPSLTRDTGHNKTGTNVKLGAAIYNHHNHGPTLATLRSAGVQLFHSSVLIRGRSIESWLLFLQYISSLNIVYSTPTILNCIVIVSVIYLGSEWWKYDFLKIKGIYYGLLYHKSCLAIPIWPLKPLKTAKNVNFWKMENFSFWPKSWHFLAHRWSKTMYKNVFG